MNVRYKLSVIVFVFVFFSCQFNSLFNFDSMLNISDWRIVVLLIENYLSLLTCFKIETWKMIRVFNVWVRGCSFQTKQICFIGLLHSRARKEAKFYYNASEAWKFTGKNISFWHEKLKFWDNFDRSSTYCYCPVNKQNTCDTVNRCRLVD